MKGMATMVSRLTTLALCALLAIASHARGEDTSGAAAPAPAPAAPAATPIYDAVAEALKPCEERLPGSPRYAQSMDAIEHALTGAQLQVHRQIYRTLVPETTALHLRFNDQDIPEAAALAPNGIALPTTWGKAIRGPLLYLGDGSLERMDGHTVRGAIVALDFSSPHLAQAFNQGAVAVVLIGHPGVSQWQAAAHFTALPMSIPAAWVPHDAAVAHGLTQADGTQTASLEISSRWTPANACNLWAKIPETKPQTPLKDEHRQAIVLSAEADTFGAIPAHCPQLRAAANCALLAEVAAGLAKGPLARPVYVVFLGSHYAAEQGARMFYYPWFPETGARSLKSRETGLFTAAIARLGRQQALVDHLDFIAKQDAEALEVYGLAHDYLVGQEADESFAITLDLTRRKDIDTRLNAPNGAIGPDEIGELKHEEELIDQERDRIAARKHGWNELRAQMGRRAVTNAGAFDPIIAWLHAELGGRIAAFTAERDEIKSDEALADAIGADTQNERVAAHFHFDFADASRPWTFSPFSLDDGLPTVGGSPGPTTFLKHIKTYGEAIRGAQVGASAVPWLPDDSIAFSYDALSQPHPRSLPIVAAWSRGIPAFACVTIGDPLDADEMPERAPCELSSRAADLVGALRAIDAWTDLPLSSPIQPQKDAARLVTQADGASIKGLQVFDLAHGSDLQEAPSKNAIFVELPGMGLNPPEAPYSLSGLACAFCAVDPSGHVFLPGVSDRAATCAAFGFDEQGAIERFTNNFLVNGASGDLAQLHFGIGGGVFTPMRPADYLVGQPSTVLIGRRDSAPRFGNYTSYEQAEALYTDTFQPIKLLGGGIDILGIAANSPRGAGVPITPSTLIALDVNAQAAEDLTALNLGRLKLLRMHNIINTPLERLQADDQDHLDAYHQAEARHQVALGAAHAMVADILGDRVHNPLRDNGDDLITAVIMLMLLSLPFSFALERLLFGFTSIYKQVAGFITFFMVTFLVLYFTHPAFSLADAPIIIFLAFIIILLSAMVTYIMMGKFKYELKALQGLSSKTHGDQSEGGTAMAAIAIGISGMRNRPLKTFLTAATVALLTFTILVFASFSSSLDVVPTTLGATRGAHRIEFHTPSFLGMPQRLCGTVGALYGDRYDVCVRGASFGDPMHNDPGTQAVDVALNPASLANQKLDAVLVVEPQEAARLAPLFAPLERGGAPGEDAPLLLSKLVADKLNLHVGDPVLIRGSRFRLGGTFEPKELKAIENIDGTRITPPDFKSTFQESNQQMGGLDNASTMFKTFDVNNFVFSSPDLIAVATPAGMQSLGYQRNLITLYPKASGGPDADAHIDEDARELAEWLDGPVNACSGHGGTRYFFTDSVQGSGFTEVIVPLLLGGLIIFSSLLGSIVDRQKEIFTFSALGLAPPDVATLFFAESAVFAVLGGMGGYLVSQLVVKTLTILASHGIATVPDVNFSSLSSIVTIFIVMATVMLSTIYPAIMAGKSANPGIARRWRMPKPDGDRLSFPFPFTVSADSIAGILAFIREHFQNHGDASLGAFAARDVALFAHQRPDGRIDRGISAEIALAPFDLGVFQRFRMTTRPSDIAGIDEVVVELERLNGAPNTWVRGNRAFIEELREQFLRWRSLPIDTVEHYNALAVGSEAAHV